MRFESAARRQPETRRDELDNEYDANVEWSESTASTHTPEFIPDNVVPFEQPGQKEHAHEEPLPVPEEIVYETSVGDLVQTPQDRGRIKALKNISRWEQEEKASAAAHAAMKSSVWGRIKGWFSRPKEDDRSLKERMQVMESEQLLESVRRKLATNPGALTKQEVVLLSDEEMNQYVRWKNEQQRQR